MTTPLTGSCLCGSVRWRYDGAITPLAHCHCSMCRKSHGSAFATYMAGDPQHFTLESGEDQIRGYESSAGFTRRFCAGCGSVVPGIADDGHMFMPAACFDGAPPLVPKIHIFVASKADWYEITDSLRQFEVFPRGAGPQSLSEGHAASPGGSCSGSCACGVLAFEVDGDLKGAMNCHCSRCRKARAAAHASNAFTDIDSVRMLRGESSISEFKVPGARFFTQAFCKHCGSPVPRRDAERGVAVIPFGAFDRSPALRPRGHIFVADKANWFELTDDLPRYEGALPS